MFADAPARLAPTLGRDNHPSINNNSIAMADVGVSAAAGTVGDGRSLHDR